MNSKLIQAGIGIVVFKNGYFIMQQRGCKHCEETSSIPGGNKEINKYK